MIEVDKDSAYEQFKNDIQDILAEDDFDNKARFFAILGALHEYERNKEKFLQLSKSEVEKKEK